MKTQLKSVPVISGYSFSGDAESSSDSQTSGTGQEQVQQTISQNQEGQLTWPFLPPWP